MVVAVFGAWDYFIVVATIVASIAIGLYFRFSGGKQKTNEEYLLAGRNMSIFPVAVSLMASLMSAITLLGLSAENYYYGTQLAVVNISYGVAIFITSRFYLPVFFGLQKTSVHEYLELRFGSQIRLLVSLTFTIQMILYNGVVLYAPAIVLETVTGFNKLVSILAVGIACTIYSTIGGMKAVLFTDILQVVLMYGAVISVVVFSTLQIGFGEIFIQAQEGGRLDFWNFSVDPKERHTWWSVILGGTVLYLSLFAINQTQIQRLLTVSTLERSQKCLWWSWPVTSILSVTTGISGLGMYAVYKHCDPLKANYITGIDQLMPYYVLDSMRHVPGLAGLMLAGIFSASLSTVSACCNALAAVTLYDFIGRWCNLPGSYIPWITKLAAFTFGLLFLGMAFLVQYLGGILQATTTINISVGGPLLGAFTLGIFTTHANQRGTLIAVVSGLALTFWVGFGGPRLSPQKLELSVEGCENNITKSIFNQIDVQVTTQNSFYLHRISYFWIGPIGFLWVIAVGSLISLLWRQQQPWERAGQTHPDLSLFTPYLANRLREKTGSCAKKTCEDETY